MLDSNATRPQILALQRLFAAIRDNLGIDRTIALEDAEDEEIPIKLNETSLIIGELEHLIIKENALLADGNVDLHAAGNACISGLDGYHAVEKAVRFPFARPNNIPEFATNQETT